jgi:hypothetical protein
MVVLNRVNEGELEIGLCYYASSLLYPKSNLKGMEIRSACYYLKGEENWTIMKYGRVL